MLIWTRRASWRSIPPILTPFEIGASARPFYTHHNTLNMDMVLRIETEL